MSIITNNVVNPVQTKYVTVSEAARHWRVSRNTIYDACRENEIDFVKIRTSLRVLIDLQAEYLTVSEAADYFSVSASSVYEACGRGEMAHIRIRSRIRIPHIRLINPALFGRKHNRGNLPPVIPPLQPVTTMGHCIY